MGTVEDGLRIPRQDFLVSYHGEHSHSRDAACMAITDDQMAQCSIEAGCKCQDSKNNTYNCVRSKSDSEDTIFCRFEDDVDFVEFYNLAQDRLQLYNLGPELASDVIDLYQKKVDALKACTAYRECSEVLSDIS